MATISSLSPPPNLLHHPTKPIKTTPKLSLQIFKPTPFHGLPKLSSSYLQIAPKHSQRLFAVAEQISIDPSSEAARRLYIGNIPRNLTNEELAKIVEEHGVVEKAEVNMSSIRCCSWFVSSIWCCYCSGFAFFSGKCGLKMNNGCRSYPVKWVSFSMWFWS